MLKKNSWGALSRESKLVDEIFALTSVKDEFDNSDHDGEPCDKCENAVEEIDGLKVNEGRLHEENEELLKQLEESLDDNTNMIQRMNVLKEEIKILQCENSKAEAGEDDVDIRAENGALKRRLGSEEYKFLSASSVAAVIESMDADTRLFYDSFLEKELNQVEQLKFLLALSNDLVPSVKHILYKNLLSGETPVQRV